MIEIIYNENNENGGRVTVKPPKNIRQLGIPDAKKKVYVEDYVYTYLHQLGKRTRQPSIGILLGKSEQSEGVQYCFVCGAVSCEDIMIDAEKIIFMEQAWHIINDRIREYFEGQDIVGWFFSKPGILLEITPNIQSAHLNYFPGVDKVFWMFEPEKGDEDVFLYDYGQLRRVSGFYIYYEKNPQMQEYMVKNYQREKPIEMKQSEDEAIRSYRQLMKEKEEEKEHIHHKKMGAVGVLATITFIALVIVGINMLNSYDKIENMQAVLSRISKTVESVSADLSSGDSSDDGSVEVQSVDSTITKQDDTQSTDTGTTDSTGSTTTDTTTDTGATDTTGTTQESETQTTTPSAQSSNTQEESYYVVQEGDSLELICQKLYNTCSVLDELCEVNGIDDKDTIYVGQKLKLI